MKIYSMTATFGKLSHQTLTLQPGLNVIHAPNEWGKSTWCAFLVAMLYGIDTRERSTQTTLADKERYAPWSGEAMSGRIDLNWNGKDITIERRTKGRSIFGEFRAYETQSGLPVEALTAANCGQMLLGVEKNVFTRSAFIRQTDMAVTQDEALRRRLNALVTTGDETGASDALAQKLRELKNQCRHNRTGALPQAESQQKIITDKLAQLTDMKQQADRLQQRQEEVQNELKLLENHRAALAYNAAREGAQRLEHATAARNEAEQAVTRLKAKCEMLPDRDFAAQQLQQLQQAQLRQKALDAEQPPISPVQPEAPGLFAGLSPSEALQQAQSDKAQLDSLSTSGSAIWLILAILSLLAGIGLMFIKWFLVIPCVILVAVFAIIHLCSGAANKSKKQTILQRYGSLPSEQWVATAQDYGQKMAAFSQEAAAVQAVANDLARRKQALQQSIYVLTQGQSIPEAIVKWESVISQHDALSEAQQSLSLAESRVTDLTAVTKAVPAPEFADNLTLSREETERAIANAAAEHHQLHKKIGQCSGLMESLGQEEVLRQQLSAANDRIARLEEIYSAVVLAQETLTQTANDLQRRFAPRISKQAQALFGKLTGSRYDRLQLTQDLSMEIGAQGEDTLRTALWRSEGTVDQLYLALRLAVARELTPAAPLILDDALVRFDDTRLATAMEILKEEAESKQVILFTCQSRETQYT